MERLGRQKKAFEFNGNALRTWGLLFLAAGVIGRGVIQAHLLGVGQVSTAQLLEMMNASETNMTLVTLSLVLQALETCAVPVFALLTVEGFLHTSNFLNYLFRVLKCGVLAEILYNFLMGNALSSRNPMFGVGLALVLLYFYKLYAGKNLKNTLIKLAVTAAAVVWCEMLCIEFGAELVLITAAYWPYREKPMYRNLCAAAMCMLCTMISPFFLAAPMSFLVIHFYNGEPCTTGRKINYLAYPAMLLAALVVTLVL